MKLAGLLVFGGTTNLDDAVDWLYRVQLLSDLLKRIAEDYEDLRSHIYETWPLLEFL